MLEETQVVALIVLENGVTWGNQKKNRKHFFIATKCLNPYKKNSEFPQHFKDLFMK